MKSLKDIIKDQNWLLLLIPVVPLIIVSWPIGAWHQWSFFWAGIVLLTLVFEALSAWLSPDKDTISDVMRKYGKDHPIRFWTVMTLFMTFCFFLVIHLATFWR